MTHNTPCANCLTLDPYSSPNQNIKLSWPRSYYHCHWQCRSFNTFRYSWRYVAIIVMFGIHLNRPLWRRLKNWNSYLPWYKPGIDCIFFATWLSPHLITDNKTSCSQACENKKKKNISKSGHLMMNPRLTQKIQSLANQWLPWQYSFDKSLTQEFSCTSGHYVLYHNKVATKITY